MTTRTIIIDADILIYRAAAAVQKSAEFSPGVFSTFADLGEAQAEFRSALAALSDTLGATRTILAVSDPDRNFRKELEPSYKAQRAGVVKPLVFKALRSWVTAEYQPKMLPRLEADDVISIFVTTPGKGDTVMVSWDKDFKSIPGTLYNPGTGTTTTITLGAANHWHLLQTLTGDAVDNYKGCPGIGPGKAAKILADPRRLHREDIPKVRWVTGDRCSSWQAIVDQYIKAGLSEKHALVQARLARLLRHGEYDLNTNKVRLWTP